MVKHIAIGAGSFGFDFWAVAQLLNAQVIGTNKGDETRGAAAPSTLLTKGGGAVGLLPLDSIGMVTKKTCAL